MAEKKIMIVDDDVEFLEELCETLTLLGYDTMPVVDSTTTIVAAHTIKPDLILLDLMMNQINGFQIADSLKRFPATSHIPIIAMSAFFSKEVHVNLMKTCGIKIFLQKPFHPLDVIAQIENVLNEKLDNENKVELNGAI